MLVDNVEEYPAFLPWCHAANVHVRNEEFVEATLSLKKGGIRYEFTTRNSRREFESIGLDLLEGPFRHLAGGWAFNDLGEEGSKVSLSLDFDFERSVANVMFGTFFEETCNSLVDSFTARAVAVYGAR